jgi:hypothetical protein
MALDFNLLRPAGGLNPVNAFFQGQQATMDREAAQQNAMLDREAAQQKAAQDREMNALRRQQLTGQIQAQEREVKSQAAAQKTSMFRDRLLRARTPEDARNLVRMQYSDPDLAPVLSQAASLEQALAEISDDPAEFERYRQQEAMGMGEWLKSQQPKVAGNAVFLPGENRFITAPREPAPVAPSAPVAVMGPDGRPQYVNREQAIGMTPFTPASVKFIGGGGGAGAGGTRAAPVAPAPKPMTALQQQSSRKAMAADKTSVKASQSVVGELEKLTDELVGNPEKGIRPDPGLAGISGFQALIPSLPTSNARKAQQKLETMKGKVMAFGRQLASLEGKLGNMAVQEWKFVSDSIQAIDPAAGNLDVQLRDIVRQAKNFANTVQERYDLTYEGAEPAAAPTAAPSGAGGSAPAASNVDQERANANAAIAAGAPAAAVRQRFKQNTGQEL